MEQVAKIDTDPWRLASFGVIDLLKNLVENDGGIDVNVKDDRGMPPLIWAVRSAQKSQCTDTGTWDTMRLLSAALDTHLLAGLLFTAFSSLEGKRMGRELNTSSSNFRVVVYKKWVVIVKKKVAILM